MKSYLCDFLQNFQFPDEAKTQLLAFYDELCEKDGSNLFSNYISEYKSGVVNYDAAIDKVKDLAGEKKISFFALALLYLIFIAEYLKIRYKKAGISENIWRDTISDLKYKAFDTKALYGVWGMKSVAFEKGVFEMKTFGFGKLQFKIEKFLGNYHKNGLHLEKHTPVLYVHVPKTGEKLDYEGVQSAYKRAAEFFKTQFRDIFKDRPMVFAFHSWLLFEKWKEVLSPQSNLMRFCGDYDVFATGEYEDYSTAWRIFDCPYEGDISKMPQDTSLRRACAQIIQREEKLGWGWGVYCPELRNND